MSAAQITYAVAIKPFKVSAGHRARPGEIIDVSGWRHLDAYVTQGLLSILPPDPDALRTLADQVQSVTNGGEPPAVPGVTEDDLRALDEAIQQRVNERVEQEAKKAAAQKAAESPQEKVQEPEAPQAQTTAEKPSQAPQAPKGDARSKARQARGGR